MQVLKKISAKDVGLNINEVLTEVSQKGNDYIVEQEGKPRVAIISMDEFERLQSEEDEFWKMTDEIREICKDVDPKELEEAITEASQANKSNYTK